MNNIVYNKKFRAKLISEIKDSYRLNYYFMQTPPEDFDISFENYFKCKSSIRLLDSLIRSCPVVSYVSDEIDISEISTKIWYKMVCNVARKKFNHYYRTKHFVEHASDLYLNSQKYKHLPPVGKETIGYFTAPGRSSGEAVFYYFLVVYLFFLENTNLKEKSAKEAIKVVNSYYMNEGRSLLCKFLYYNKTFYSKIYNVILVKNRSKKNIFEKDELFKIVISI